jgi:hypothetical protein
MGRHAQLVGDHVAARVVRLAGLLGLGLLPLPQRLQASEQLVIERQRAKPVLRLGLLDDHLVVDQDPGLPDCERLLCEVDIRPAQAEGLTTAQTVQRQDAAIVTAAQLRQIIERLVAAGQWRPGDPDIWIVADAGYDGPRLAHLLAGLPVQVLVRMRSDRVLRRAAPPHAPGTRGRPRRHGGEFVFGDATT